MVVYYNKGRGVTEEYTCGWGHAPLLIADRSDKINIEIHSGEPSTSTSFGDDLNKSKSVLNNVKDSFKNSSSN